MQGFRCRVTNVTSEKRLERAKPPIPCKGEPGNCVKGAKQIIVWHRKSSLLRTNEGQLKKRFLELEGNNVEDEYEFPGYNIDMGWSNGKPLQKDENIYVNALQEHKMIYSSSLTRV